MRKLITSIIIALTAITISAQSSFPPKNYPASIKVMTDAGVAQYWNVKRIMCLGKSGSGYKFRIYGQAEATTGSQSIELFYILPGDKLQTAGTYRFPAITKGEPFQFEVTSAFVGYAPKSFLGFLIMDENLKVNEQVSPTHEENIAPSSPIEIPIIEEEVEEIIPAVDYNAIFTDPETKPEFPGGTAAIYRHIAKTMRYPLIAQENGKQGKVTVSFIIEKDGALSDVKVTKGVDPNLDKEAIRIIKTLPNFTPGKMNGKPVRTSMSLPVTFKLN